MIKQIENRLKFFREKIYQFFHRGRDASMELTDSLSSNTTAKSVVELSLNPEHRRNYCSITRAVGEFYSDLDVKGKQDKHHYLTRILSEYCLPLQKRTYHLFTLDCTSNPRLFSPTLADRSFVYSPNPVSGNKPITIGHQYSVAAYLPEKLTKDTSPWIIPLSCERVSTKGASQFACKHWSKNNQIGWICLRIRMIYSASLFIFIRITTLLLTQKETRIWLTKLF